MDGGSDLLTGHEVRIRPLSTVEYHRLSEVGVLNDGERVELIEGQLVAMSPIGPRHALVVDTLTELLVLAARGRARVRVQNPVVLSSVSEPNPDVVLARVGWSGYPAQHPGPHDILLLVEVSESSLAIDRRVKQAMYARAGIGEYWIVDLTKTVVHVHRAPKDGIYQALATRRGSDMLDVEALAGITVQVDMLFA